MMAVTALPESRPAAPGAPEASESGSQAPGEQHERARRTHRRRSDAGVAPRRRWAESVRSWLDSTYWTEEAYLALPASNHLIELVDGRLVLLELPTLRHQDVVLELAFALRAWNHSERRGRLVIAAYPVRLRPGLIREPDVLFYLSEHADRAQEQVGGPPDLAVEVLSPSTRHTDLREKLAEYAAAGVQEYWVADPNRRWIEVYVLEGDRYRRLGRYGAGQQAASRLLAGFVVDVDSLFGGAGASGD
jgi:Uma2 family endonuclease